MALGRVIGTTVQRLATSRLDGLLALLVLAVTVPIVVGAFGTPLGYDEAYNLQISVTLADEGRYATDGSLVGSPERAMFDYFITTGPTVLVPVAGIIAVAGAEPWVVRVVPCLFYLATLAAAFGVGGRLGSGRTGGLLAVLAALSVDLSTDAGLGYRGAGDVLGEVPSAFLILAAALLLRRSLFLAGLLVGLALLTKSLMVLAVPAFVVAALVGADHGGAARLRRPVALLAGLLLPIVVWTAVQMLVMGPDGWAGRTLLFVRQLALGGGGVAQNPSYRSSLSANLLASWSAVEFLPLVVIAVAGLWALRSRQLVPPGEGERTPPEVTQLALALAGSAVLILTWWTFITERPLGRYLVTPLILLAVVGAGLSFRAAMNLRERPDRWSKMRSLAGTAGVVGLVGLAAGHSISALDGSGALASQQRVAGVVRDQVEAGSGIDGAGWFQNPDIRFLAGVPLEHPSSPNGDVTLLLLGPDLAAQMPDQYVRGLRQCTSVLVRDGDYVLCRTDAGGGTPVGPPRIGT